jgi:hypothetical protein
MKMNKDFQKLVASDINEERLLNFFFRKGGIVNINHLNNLVRQKTNTSGVRQLLYNLRSDKLIVKLTAIMINLH